MADFIERIHWVLSGESEDEILTAFGHLETPEEIHFVADRWNWDDGATPVLMRQIIDSEHCDLGTAYLVYWRTDGVFASYRSVDETEGWERDFFRMCLRIEEKVKERQFRTSCIRFDPLVEFDTVSLQRLLSLSPRAVPAFMLEATPGEVLPSIDI